MKYFSCENSLKSLKSYCIIYPTKIKSIRFSKYFQIIKKQSLKMSKINAHNLKINAHCFKAIWSFGICTNFYLVQNIFLKVKESVLKKWAQVISGYQLKKFNLKVCKIP